MNGFFESSILQAVVVSFLIAQFIKVFSYSIRLKKFYLKGLVESGGFPSGHSAVVACLTMMILLEQGFSSLFFAALIFSFIIMYDAMGVRKETEKQAKVLMTIVKKNRMKNVPELRQFLGHTFLEVLVGASIGVLVALLFSM
jgi:acid phosphatase family membrane protein YuiD